MEKCKSCIHFDVCMLRQLSKSIILCGDYLAADELNQLRNKTIGGQGSGKAGMDDSREPKGYRDGLAQGYRNAQRYVARLFEKHLDYRQKSEKPNKNQEKAAQKFAEFLEVDNGKATDHGE